MSFQDPTEQFSREDKMNEKSVDQGQEEFVNYESVETKYHTLEVKDSSKATLKSNQKSLSKLKLQNKKKILHPKNETTLQTKNSSKLLIRADLHDNALNESEDSLNQLRIMYSNSSKEQVGLSKLKKKSQKLNSLNTSNISQKSNKFRAQEKKSKKKPIRTIQASEITNNHQFIKNFIPKNRKLAGVLKRNRTCLKRFFPQFDLYLTEELKYIMTSKRKACFSTSTYHMGSKIQSVSELQEEYTGTLQSNFAGDLWNFYDNSFGSESRILATICYHNQITFSFSPRSLEVYIVSPYYNYSDLIGSHLNKNLQELYEINENRENRRVIKLINKKPVFNQERGTWLMDFNGKAPISSVKNMILVDATDERKEVMLLTKASEEAYNFQVSFPLSVRTAMAIANSSFDFKWVCQ